MTPRFRAILRAGIALGAVIDATVCVLALFFQPLLGPLFDIPVRDPALATIVGGEYVVVTLIYVLLLRDLERYRGLLYLIAIDQALAALLPAVEIARGHVAATFKTIGPIPISAALAGSYLYAARRLDASRPRSG